MAMINLGAIGNKPAVIKAAEDDKLYVWGAHAPDAVKSYLSQRPPRVGNIPDHLGVFVTTKGVDISQCHQNTLNRFCTEGRGAIELFVDEDGIPCDESSKYTPAATVEDSETTADPETPTLPPSEDELLTQGAEIPKTTSKVEAMQNAIAEVIRSAGEKFEQAVKDTSLTKVQLEAARQSFAHQIDQLPDMFQNMYVLAHQIVDDVDMEALIMASELLNEVKTTTFVPPASAGKARVIRATKVMDKAMDDMRRMKMPMP